MIPDGAIVSGFISKIINDLVDVTKEKLKKLTVTEKLKTRVWKQEYIR